MMLDLSEWTRLALEQFWQVTLVAIVLGGTAVLIRRRRPHLAYLLWMLVVVKSVTPPLWASPWGIFCQAVTPIHDEREIASSVSGASSEQAPAFPVAAYVTNVKHSAFATDPATNRPTNRPTSSSGGMRFARAISHGSLIVWGLGCVGMGALILWKSVRFSRRLRGRWQAPPPLLQRKVDWLRFCLGVTRRVRTQVCRHPLMPSTTGILRPRILLAQDSLDILAPAELRGVLAHELMHVRRWDSVANCVQLASQCLWWFHPLLWWVNREARRERERCCDEGVIAFLHCPAQEYAHTLLRVLESHARSELPATVLGMSTFHATHVRLESLVKHLGAVRAKTPLWQWGAALLLAFVILPGWSRRIEADGQRSEPVQLKVQSVEYQGNKKIKTESLSELSGLVPGESAFSTSKNREAMGRILQHYHEKGYSEAKVSLETGDKETDRHVTFLIVEGPKARIVVRIFTGNEFFSTSILKTKLKTKTAVVPKLTQNVFAGKYHPGIADEDVASLKEYYHSLGFFSVEIHAIAHVSDDRANVTIEYIIKEGVRFKVGNIEIEGNKVFTESQIRNHLDAKKSDDYYSAARIEKAIEKIEDDYAQMGRIFAPVNVERRFPEEPGMVDLILHFDEDTVYRIRRLEPVIGGGHPPTNETVTLNALPFPPLNVLEFKRAELGKKQFTKQFVGNGVFMIEQYAVKAPKTRIPKPAEVPVGENR